MQWLLTIQLLAAAFGVVRTQEATQRNGVATTCNLPPVVGFTGSVYATLDKNLAAQQLQKNVFHFSNTTVSFEAILLFSLENYVLPHLTAICMPSIIIFTFLVVRLIKTGKHVRVNCFVGTCKERSLSSMYSLLRTFFVRPRIYL